MAKTLAHTIGTLDNLVFPNAGITKIAITPEAPRSGESHYGYAPPGANDDGSGDYYQIFGVGIDKAIKDEVSTEHIVLIKDKLTKHCSFGDYPPITLDELRIQIAGHEIRHRVECRGKISFFSPRIRSQMTDPYLKTLILYVHCVLLVNRPKENYRKEFDAMVVEHIVGEMWHWGERDLATIAKIIGTGAKKMPDALKGTKLAV